MTTTRTNHRDSTRRQPWLKVAVLTAAAVLAAATCGGDDDEDSAQTAGTTGGSAAPDSASTATEATATETTVTTVTETTTETTVTGTSATETTVAESTWVTGEAVDVVNNDGETCEYRSGELIATLGQAGAIEDLLGDVGAVIEGDVLTPDDSPFDVGLSLYQLPDGIDPLEAAALVDGQLSIEAAPNYMYSYAPGWRYAPGDEPVEMPAPAASAAPLPVEFNARIAVLDTGYLELDGAPAATLDADVDFIEPDQPPPGAGFTDAGIVPDEVTSGLAAGHGTFIVNMLAQLLPETPILATGITPRFAEDDQFVGPDDGRPVSVRDDSSLTWSLLVALRQVFAEQDGRLLHINMSFGTYGCSGADPDESYHEPLGLGTVIDQLDGRDVEVFAASGNDGVPDRAPNAPSGEIFYPAGFLSPLLPWLHSVASDPTSSGVDYSNRGPWVEQQAAGSHVVSYLPETTRPVATSTPSTSSTTGGNVGSSRDQVYPEGWYSWSGTSFATPCALAARIAGQPATADTQDGSGPYTECAINQEPVP